MSNTAPTLATPQDPEAELAALRGELDRLDDALHDLLMRRAETVGLLARLNAKAGMPLRPGREATIIRRLLARHGGALPRQAVVRIWRELFAATTAMQGLFTIAVCEPAADAGFTAIAREHFGAMTPLHAHRSPSQALGEVSVGNAAAAVLPMPSEMDNTGESWWTSLLQSGETRMYVVARLPFWAPRPEGAPRAQALVVAAVPPDPSGNDRALVGLEIPAELSRGSLNAALAAAGLQPGPVILRREAGSPTAHALAEIAGHLADDDPRLPAIVGLRRPPVVLGAYAVPEDGVAA